MGRPRRRGRPTDELGRSATLPPPSRLESRLVLAHGPVLEAADAGLRVVDGLDLDGYQYFHATRAELLRRLGRRAEAHDELERALALTRFEPERRFLRRRLREVGF